LDYYSLTDNNARSNNRFLSILGGRIFPKSDPYCLASFRIEIKIPLDYPFKAPDGYFLDPIYHPMVGSGGRHCCCWGFGPDSWLPRKSIVDYITGMINAIDYIDQWNGHGDSYRYFEYSNNYSVFYEKALQSVFRYGQSRLFISSKQI
jgi:ubiquitin-protein ligase